MRYDHLLNLTYPIPTRPAAGRPSPSRIGPPSRLAVGPPPHAGGHQILIFHLSRRFFTRGWAGRWDTQPYLWSLIQGPLSITSSALCATRDHVGLGAESWALDHQTLSGAQHVSTPRLGWIVGKGLEIINNRQDIPLLMIKSRIFR